MNLDKLDIKSMLPDELEDCFEAMGEKRFRARQVFSWLHKGAEDFSVMTDLSAGLREKLEKTCHITVPQLAQKQESRLDGTIKYLWRLYDGAAIESVLMRYERWNTICVSTQAGCAMGCVFCASSIGGLERNLQASEILDQVIFSRGESGVNISNIVLMGVGEPLDNFDNVMRFMRLITHPLGMNIGARHISLSTCGIIENIDKIAEYGIQFNLTVSLHAPDDETRNRLMPGCRKGGVDDLLEACARYFKKTGRRVSYEYAMIGGINDTPYHARLLAEKLKNTGSHLNLIMLSAVPERQLNACAAESLKAFINILKQKGINYTLRRSLGVDIDASCGQLRRRTIQNPSMEGGSGNGTLGNN